MCVLQVYGKPRCSNSEMKAVRVNGANDPLLHCAWAVKVYATLWLNWNSPVIGLVKTAATSRPQMSYHMSTCAVDMYVCVCVYGCQHIKTDALDIFKRSYRFNELLPRTPLPAHTYTHTVLQKGWMFGILQQWVTWCLRNQINESEKG